MKTPVLKIIDPSKLLPQTISMYQWEREIRQTCEKRTSKGINNTPMCGNKMCKYINCEKIYG